MTDDEPTDWENEAMELFRMLVELHDQVVLFADNSEGDDLLYELLHSDAFKKASAYLLTAGEVS